MSSTDTANIVCVTQRIYAQGKAGVKQITPYPKYVAEDFKLILPLKMCCSSAGEHGLISGILVFPALCACLSSRQCDRGHTTALKVSSIPVSPVMMPL